MNMMMTIMMSFFNKYYRFYNIFMILIDMQNELDMSFINKIVEVEKSRYHY